MQRPNFITLQEIDSQKGPSSFSYATFAHPNPKFYKYYWWVFWKNSPCDGYAFLNKQNRLPTKQAFNLMYNIRSENEPYWLYNERLPRLDPVNTPFNPNAAKWKNIEWAKAFDIDPDEIYKGMK